MKRFTALMLSALLMLSLLAGCGSDDAAAGSDGFELYAQLVGQFAALGEKFERHFFDGNAVYLAIYEYVVHSDERSYRG